MDVYSKGWLLLSRGGSNLSLKEEDSSLRSGSRRLRQLPHGMGSILHRFTTPMDQWKWKMGFIARRNWPEDERRSDAMTKIGMEDSSSERTQRIYARIAGFLFLWLIITGLAGTIIISHIVGSGTFAETAKRGVASEHLYCG